MQFVICMKVNKNFVKLEKNGISFHLEIMSLETIFDCPKKNSG